MRAFPRSLHLVTCLCECVNLTRNMTGICFFQSIFYLLHMSKYMLICVFFECVCEREKESDRHRDRQRQRKTEMERENRLKRAELHTWRSENSLWQSALSFHHGVPGIGLRLPVLVASHFIP